MFRCGEHGGSSDGRPVSAGRAVRHEGLRKADGRDEPADRGRPHDRDGAELSEHGDVPREGHVDPESGNHRQEEARDPGLRGRSAPVRLALNAACLRMRESKPHRRLPVRYAATSQTGQRGERVWIMLVLRPTPHHTQARSG